MRRHLTTAAGALILAARTPGDDEAMRDTGMADSPAAATMPDPSLMTTVRP